MSRTSRQTMSAEQRREQAAALHASIADQVHALRGSEEWRRFLDFSRSFHTYSLNNVLLILAQRPTATAVAGYRQWQTKGRQVRKGEQAIRIFGYSTKRITEEDPATGEELEKRLTRFPVLSVFDITQTDLIDGEEDHATIAHRLIGTDDLGIAAAVRDHLTATGWTVTREQLDGHTNGYTTNHGRRVVIETHLSPAQAAKTLLHEAAHITLGHLEAPHSDYLTHRGVMECEAESVAYVLAGLLGLDASAHSIGYIATWSDPDADTHGVGEDIHATATRVLGAVHTLADALEPAMVPPAMSRHNTNGTNTTNRSAGGSAGGFRRSGRRGPVAPSRFANGHPGGAHHEKGEKGCTPSPSTPRPSASAAP